LVDNVFAVMRRTAHYQQLAVSIESLYERSIPVG